MLNIFDKQGLIVLVYLYRPIQLDGIQINIENSAPFFEKMYFFFKARAAMNYVNGRPDITSTKKMEQWHTYVLQYFAITTV